MATQPEPSKLPTLLSLAGFVQSRWPQLLRDSCATVVVIASVWAGFSRNEQDFEGWVRTPSTVLLIAVAVIGAVGAVYSWKREPALTDLKVQAKQLEDELFKCQGNYNDLLAKELWYLSSQLQFTHCERISVYKHDGEAFVMLGRYSGNPNFNQRRRGVHPDNQGCISEVWCEGRAYRTKLPNPDTNCDRYLKVLHDLWQLDPEVSRQLPMKCRSIGGIRVEREKTNEPIAVIMFESLKAERVNAATLDEAARLDAGRIGRFIERMEAIEPTPSLAAKIGF